LWQPKTIFMKSLISACVLSFFLLNNSYAQTTAAQDSLMAKKSKDSVMAAKAVKDSIRWATLEATASFPLIKNSKWSGVFPVKDIKEKPDTSMKYKLLMNLTEWEKDTASIRQISSGLAEIGRIINLHAAAGVPKENLDVVIVVHGGALNAFLTNPEYQAKFKMDNPSMDILKQFLALKARFIACGQAKLFLDIPTEKMIPELNTALTAQVALSTYQLKGYVMYKIDGDK
jgi:intracellular sulfur oxidation DsrE/DsrF family protein